MKLYVKPELEMVEFATESVALKGPNVDIVSGDTDILEE